MTATDLVPRFPIVPSSRGHYESFYLTAHEPAAPHGFWIRYTVRKQPGKAPVGSLWFTHFTADGPWATKISTPSVTAGPHGTGIAIGSAVLHADAAIGAANEASWKLAMHGSDAPLAHMPHEWMYRAPLPKTKATSHRPVMTLAGAVTVNGETIDVTGWHGMLGHNWGASHAARWIWLHGAEFDGLLDWVDVVIGRVAVGRWTTPWIAQGALSLDGHRHAIGGIGKSRSTTVDDRHDGATVTLSADGLGRIVLEASAPLNRFVGWEYADPSGDMHQVRNCSVAGLRLRVDDRVFCTDFGAAYELGTHEVDPDLAVQPFPDV